jgi:hypothetical protein
LEIEKNAKSCSRKPFISHPLPTKNKHQNQHKSISISVGQEIGLYLKSTQNKIKITTAKSLIFSGCLRER